MRFTLRRVPLALLIAGAIQVPASATENGQISYPFGVNTVLNGLLPPPGNTQYFNYSLYYASNRFAGPGGGNAVPGFHLSVVAETPRVVHTWARPSARSRCRAARSCRSCTCICRRRAGRETARRSAT